MSLTCYYYFSLSFLLCLAHLINVVPSANSMSLSSAKWCPEKQIYVDGTIASSDKAQNYIDDVIQKGSPLYIFGYGSLCWNPGQSVLASPSVKSRFGSAKGFVRTWAQRSADHRGTPNFNGLVCSLLTDEEYQDIVSLHRNDSSDSLLQETPRKPSVTEGVLYEVPPPLVQKCLEELDFREKGGYARDVIDVLINDEGVSSTVKALLYRGTPDNPAFSSRALLDEIYAAAVMSAAVGPSGPNDHYLYSLDEFLKRVRENEGQVVSTHEGDTLTGRLATLTKQIQNDYHVYFLYGSGSNQHDQLMLHMPTERFGNAAKLIKGDEAHELKEFLLIVPKTGDTTPKVKRVFAGGGHSALLSNEGDLYLWGWNDSFQLGREEKYIHNLAFPVIPKLSLKVSDAALGHNHTLIVEKNTSHLYAFGDNRRGQVTGSMSDGDRISKPTKLDVGEVAQVAAGLFHSAVITKSGELITFGCDRFGQTLKKRENDLFGRWKPPDGSRLLKVRCGQKHTLALDEFGRIWSMGDNKYGQLGRESTELKDGVMKLVDGELGQENSKGCIDIDCGWSHCIALVPTDSGQNKLYGFGRNDFYQLGSSGDASSIRTPIALHDISTDTGIKCLEVCCGSESTIVLDDSHKLHAVGWNEHGNLGIGNSVNSATLSQVQGPNISTPRTNIDVESEGGIVMAAGGAHFICTLHSL